MVLIAAEMLAQNPGLGKFVWDEFQNGSSQSLGRIMVAVFTIGFIGFLLDRIMQSLQQLASSASVRPERKTEEHEMSNPQLKIVDRTAINAPPAHRRAQPSSFRASPNPTARRRDPGAEGHQPARSRRASSSPSSASPAAARPR